MASKMRIPGGTLAELLRFVIYESRDSIILQHFSIVQERESYYTKDVLYLSADFTNKLGRCLEGPSGGYEVIDQQHICTCLYILCMYLVTSSPYSRENRFSFVSPGSLPAFRTRICGTFSLSAKGAEKRKPRASTAATASIFTFLYCSTIASIQYLKAGGV